jgi:predicted permease
MQGWLTSVQLRMRALLNRSKLEQDVEDELAFHLAMKAEKLNDPDAARRRFGNEARISEDVRDAWTFRWLESVWLDVRHAARAVARTPGFATIAVLSLTLGIGANTAIFTVLHEFFLKSLPIESPDRLRILTWTGERGGPARSRSGYSMTVNGVKVDSSFSVHGFEQIKSRADAFQSVGGFTELDPNVYVRGQALIATGMIVTSGFFDALGTRAQLGRTFTESDMEPEAPSVAVISWALYERAFGADAAALGSTITVNRVPTTVVGILPRGLTGLTRAFPVDIYVPMARRGDLAKADEWRADRWWIQMIGRLRPGVTDQLATAQVDAALHSATAAASELLGEKLRSPKAVLHEGRTGLTFLNQRNESFLRTLLAMVVIVLLIACANVTNLLLARGTARARELAVRQSLGAGRGRIIRHLLTETLMIAAVGGALGFALAQIGTTALTSVIVPHPEARVTVQPDALVLAFTILLTTITALVTGVIPAVRASSVQPAGSLRHAGAAACSMRQRLARGLVGVQVALAVVLLAGAGMFSRTLSNLNSVHIGFKADNLLLFSVDGRRNGYEGDRLIRLYERIYEKIAAVPGVHALTHSRHALLSGSASNRSMTVPGYLQKPQPGAWVHEAGDQFLSVMGIPILAGRDLQPSDHEKAPRVAVINQTMANKYFGGNALGREFGFGSDMKEPVRVVGIAADARYDRLTSEIPPTAYTAWRQSGAKISSANFEVRTSVDPKSVTAAIRRVVAEIDPTLPVANFRTQRQQIDRSIARERTFAMLGILFSGVAVLLACIGIYGVLAYSVTRRTSEFGVRLALGATPRGIAWLVIRGMVTPIGLAVVAGVPASIAAFRLIESMLYGVKATDPVTLTGAIAAILIAAMLAALIPSRRAAKCDPAIALRYE